MSAIDDDPVRCADKATSEQMITEIESAHRDGDTLGGVVEVLAFNMPPGLGSHVHWDRRLIQSWPVRLWVFRRLKALKLFQRR